MFVIKERSGCFATSNPPTFGIFPSIGAYQLGVRSLNCTLSITNAWTLQLISVRSHVSVLGAIAV